VFFWGVQAAPGEQAQGGGQVVGEDVGLAGRED